MSSIIETSESSDDETFAPEPEGFPSSGNWCFKKPALIIDDDALYCVHCSTEFYGDCPNHGPLIAVQDSKLDNKNGGAKETAPAQVLIKSDGVWTRDVIPARVRFGPLVGKSVPFAKASSQYSWLVRKFGEDDHCVDASDARNSNWMRYVNCALQFRQRNMEAIQYRGHIYFVTTRRVEPKEELLVWSGPKPQTSHLQGGESGYGKVIVEKNGTSEERTSLEKSEECMGTCSVPWECSRCVEEVLDVDLLEALLRSEKVDGGFICVECRETYSHLKKMAEHLKSGCQVSAQLPSSAPRPIPSSTPSPAPLPETFSPNISDQSRDSDDAKEKSLARSSSCKEFSYTSISAQDRKYTAEKSLICKTFCKESGSYQIHTGDKTHACSRCDKKFLFKYELSRHLKTHEGEEKTHVCTYCDMKFPRNCQLVVHVRKHTGERPFACPQCDKKFAANATLARHLRTHTGERPFACKLCDKTFSTDSTLQFHLKLHAGGKRHACTYCDKKFVAKSELTRHVRSHTGEKPYACSHCDKRYAGPTGLKLHLRRYHQEKFTASPQYDKFLADSNLKEQTCITEENALACEDCGEKFPNRSKLCQHLRMHDRKVI